MPHARAPRPKLRRLLTDLSGAAAVALALAACAGGTPAVEGPGIVMPGGQPATQNYADSLTDPLVVRSINGVLSATLDVSFADLPVTRSGAIGVDTVYTDTVTTDTLPLRAYTLAATTDTSYRPNDPRFTPRFPGPTFRVRPGDLVQIWLRNKLPRPRTRSDSNTVCMTYPASAPTAAPRDTFQDCFHGPNFTNIHYHGMHVTPDSTSTVVGDDVLLVIAPGDSILYSFRVPMNQSPGTHWYHPHKHGSVALQVANGMAGAFIVEDPTRGLDRFTQQHNLREHLIGFQQIDTTVGLLHGDKTNILDKVPPLVNGQDAPVIYMAPGEVQRWRIVNENVTRNTKTLEFRFQDLPGDEPVAVEVARDGVQFSPVNVGIDTDTVLLMGAGNRLDVIVQAPLSEGRHLFRIRHLPGASRETRDPVLPVQALTTPAAAVQASAQNSYVLFTVVVDSSLTGSSTGLPTRIPNLAQFLAANMQGPPPFLGGNLPMASPAAMVVFTDSGSPGNAAHPAQFFLGDVPNPFQRFNDTVVFVPSDSGGTAMPMVLGGTQTWKIVNNSAVRVNHPFHIHINPFQVNQVVAPNPRDPFRALYDELNRAATTNQSPIWLDVIPLPQPAVDANGNSIPNSAYVVITQRYDDFEGCVDGKCGPPTGNFVMHCHILGHEERGMMQVLQIIPPGGQVTPLRRGGHGAGGHQH
jgi:FtsP/CotA-like multicopper oxidase with cupredoxin domain